MSSATYNFKGQVALVTGAASGIGAATALQFADAGASVVLADVQTEAGEALAKKIQARDGKALFVKADMASEADIKNMVAAAVKQFGRLDFAFNNAGIEGSPADTINCTNENWDRTMNINLRGVWQCMKYEIPEMLKVGGGAIVNCSSVAGVVGFTGIPAYTASKHGVLGLTKTAALEYANKNIRVNAVCPGVIKTPMIDRFTHGEAQATQALMAGEPLGRMGQPEEIASSVLWLCSAGAAFVTGHPLVVDGGWVAR
jgi:NAD(P)-dependent dehydrogenase (short-subunit alcohol dehydrogenase family)